MRRSTPLKRTGFKPKVSSQPGILRTATLPDLQKLTKPRMRKCKICKTPFRPFNAMRDKWCSPECGAALALRLTAQKERKEVLARKAALKTLSDWLKEAQVAFNAFIRERDLNEPCISCGRFHTGSYDAGHYRAVGSMPTLRFNEDNVHKQCVPCNQFKSGNVVEYRLRLATKIGADRMAFLEGPHAPVKMTIDDAKTIKRIYQLKLKDLRAARAEKGAA